MIYQIFREESDIKYNLPKVVKLMNATPNAEMYGDIGTYEYILNHSKKNNFSIIGIYQARRCLSLNEKPLDYDTIIKLDPNKIYHTIFYCAKNLNIPLWEKAHPEIKDVLIESILTIKNMFPEYVNAVDQCVSSNILFPHNMFVMPRTEFVKYCEWLFKILNCIKIEKDCGIPKPYSLLAERLFTIWCMHNYLPKDQVFTSAISYDKDTGKLKNSVNGISK